MFRGQFLVGLLVFLSVSSTAHAGILIWENEATGGAVQAPGEVKAESAAQKSADEDGSSAFAWLDELVGELAELVGGK